MKKLERYRNRLAELEAQRSRLVREGDLIMATALNNDIKRVEGLIKEAEEYEEAIKPKPIKELIPMDKIHESGIIPMIMECHLAADYLNACSYQLYDAIKAMGFNPVSLIPDMDEIIKKSNAFASILCDKNQCLSDLLTDNDTLLNALHKKTVSYITQRTTTKHKSHKENGTD